MDGVLFNVMELQRCFMCLLCAVLYQDKIHIGNGPEISPGFRKKTVPLECNLKSNAFPGN